MDQVVSELDLEGWPSGNFLGGKGDSHGVVVKGQGQSGSTAPHSHSPTGRLEAGEGKSCGQPMKGGEGKQNAIQPYDGGDAEPYKGTRH